MHIPLSRSIQFHSRILNVVSRTSTSLHPHHLRHVTHIHPTSSRSYSTDNNSLNVSIQYCRDLVRKSDYENYLCTLFTPNAETRHLIWALRAFNIEAAQVQDIVSDVNIGRMRLLWWKQTLEALWSDKGATVPDQPVLQILGKALREGVPLSLSWMNKILTARTQHLETHHFPTLKSLETYAEATVSSLLYLQLESLGLKNLEADHLASHIGKAAGVAILLRGTPFHIGQNRFYIPADVCAKHGVATEDVYRLVRSMVMESKNKNTSEPIVVDKNVQEKLADAVFEVATLANDHIITARTHLKESVPAEAFPAFLHAVPTTRYLKQLEECQFNVFDPKLQRRQGFWLPFEVWRAKRKGMF